MNLNDGHIHEAIDRLSVAQDYLSQSLSDHALIESIPEFKQKIEYAIEILAELYSDIGSYESIEELKNRENIFSWEVLEHSELNLPAWARTFAVGHDGTIFVPGEINNLPEKEVLICALSDSVRYLTFKNHKYFPSAWLASVFPDTAEICSIIESAAKKIIAKSKHA